MNAIKPTTWLYAGYGIALAYLFGYQLYLAWGFTIDDAYITLRYAEHLVSHQGVVWNIGEPPHEGYSNFTYLLLATLFLKLNVPPMLGLKVFSVLMLGVGTVGLYHLSRLWLPRLYAMLPPLLLFCHPGQPLWGVSGLETPFYQALIIYGTYYFLCAFEASSLTKIKRNAVSSGLLLAIAGLTRPEAPLVLVSFLTVLSWLWLKGSVEPSHKPRLIKLCRYLLSAFAFIYLPYFISRWWYFGKLFPNPVYCKAMNAPSGPFELDMLYLFVFLPLMIVALPYLKKASDLKNYFVIAPTIAYLLALYNADWIVGFLDRHFLAAFALVLPLYVKGMLHLFSHEQLQLKPPYQSYLIVGITLLFGWLFIHKDMSPSHIRLFANSAARGNQLRLDTARWLQQHVKHPQAVALGDCGLIPYVFKGTVIDSYCLNSIDFGKAPILYSYQRFSQWLLNERKPEYIVLIGLASNRRDLNTLYVPHTEKYLLQSPLFKSRYNEVALFTTRDDVTEATTSNYYQYAIYQRQLDV